MADRFELEHWKSRATVAEDERDSARYVLATLRGFFRKAEAGEPVMPDKVRAALRTHDQTWWTRADAINAVAEALLDVDEEQPK